MCIVGKPSCMKEYCCLLNAGQLVAKMSTSTLMKQENMR